MELFKRHADVGAAVVEERGVSAGVVHVVLEHGGGTTGACDIEDVEPTLTRFSQAGTTTSMKALYSSVMVGSPFVSQYRESEVDTATTRHPAVPRLPVGGDPSRLSCPVATIVPVQWLPE